MYEIIEKYQMLEEKEILKIYIKVRDKIDKKTNKIVEKILTNNILIIIKQEKRIYFMVKRK